MRLMRHTQRGGEYLLYPSWTQIVLILKQTSAEGDSKTCFFMHKREVRNHTIPATADNTSVVTDGCDADLTE